VLATCRFALLVKSLQWNRKIQCGNSFGRILTSFIRALNFSDDAAKVVFPTSPSVYDWCLGFVIKILLKSVMIIGFVRQCFMYFLFKHVALPVIHHTLMQFIGMSSSKWKWRGVMTKGGYTIVMEKDISLVEELEGQ